ncbi:DUF2537 domain-containing protein [Actinokineospora globicatena]|uniref:DUF2537 domain-containing protein n=1 Tax=Actinokineospora globicatena TaxID=103729 RepID=A0A9W6QQQ2_9PSEU|nr:DUF2537 domain-containing protein [Actinokineospora globicatena]MCP2300761.1 Protein of unknown function (DUF2537) [Actinokineospora globicatena]GLW77614.1 hypothetical protein Aglo01_20960 [Actinokineospora globicatena]GLW84450.1 hypothetical protein Aglo02_20900 [Actinokineospora globicatena]GLW92968.1 hypothetical protein Aglo03_37840 [Actinokineospora globicatena]
MELRARDDRAILIGDDGTGEREVDPHTLALGSDLSTALHEWAKVAAALRRGTDEDPDQAAELVTKRGRQLAERVAAVMGTPVSYVDPLSGEVSTVNPPEVIDAPAAEETVVDEPTPWGVGLLVAGFTGALVLFSVITLAVTLYETNPLLAVASNLVISAGLLPSVWLARKVPTWRWVAVGVAAGIGLGWLTLPFIVFG